MGWDTGERWCGVVLCLTARPRPVSVFRSVLFCSVLFYLVAAPWLVSFLTYLPLLR